MVDRLHILEHELTYNEQEKAANGSGLSLLQSAVRYVRKNTHEPICIFFSEIPKPLRPSTKVCFQNFGNPYLSPISHAFFSTLFAFSKIDEVLTQTVS